jgi:hypothetical protein
MKVYSKIILVACNFSVAALIFFSCTNNQPEEKKRVFEGYGSWMDTVLKSPAKILRGLEPGDALDSIKKSEQLVPIEEDSASVYYEIKADSVTDVSITYSIDDKKLDEMEMIIRTKNHDAGTAVYNDLKKYFEAKFSTPEMDKGIYVFTGKTTNGQPVHVSLEDESGIDNGQIKIFVYRDK